MAAPLSAPVYPIAAIAPRSRPHRQVRQARQTALPELSVVIVNYRQWHETTQLVRQLQAAACVEEGQAEIVIVDNHSPYHRLAARLRRQPGVSLRRWRRNRGYARAVNEGCRLSRGRWLLVLNPDVSVCPGFLDGVLSLSHRLAVQEPSAGVVGFHLRNPDRTLQRSCGFFPNLVRTFASMLLPRAQRKCREVRTHGRCRVSWVTGCCLLLRRDCVQQLGGFDEKFFLYYEDVDLCRRARARGWSVWYEPDLWAVHHRPLHSRTVSPFLRVCTRHALLLYGAKHWAPWEFHLLAGLVRVEAWFRQRRALRRQDRRSARLFRGLGRMVSEIAAGRHARARRRLDYLVLQEEKQLFS